MPLRVLRASLVAVLMAGCSAPAAPENPPAAAPNTQAPAAAGPVSFKLQVAPVLKNSCGGCHTPSGPSGGVVLFDAAGEIAHERITAALGNIIQQIETRRMPRGSNPRLTASELATLKQWQAEGAANN